MSKQIYGWKRFWCPRSGSINLADGGYLSDPEGEWGKACNPDLVSLEAISHLPCLALLGEPGIGKTKALEVERSKIVGKIQEQGDQVLFLDLRSYGSEDRLVRSLFDSPEFKAWQAGTHRLHIFLDSFDECLLRVDTLATLLVDEFKRYQNAVHRLFLRIACRTAVWQPVLEEGLKEIWGENSVGVYELAPLRRIDVIEAAKAERYPPDDFLEEVHRKNIVPLAIKPITLGFLLNTYDRHGGQFPPNQKLRELYLEGCKLLCEEINGSRRGSNRRGDFDVDQRLIVAARTAAITIFANRFAVWTGVDQGNVPIEDVLLQELCYGYETANGREFEITRAVIEEVLDTGLFSSRGLHRMGWAHQTYAEFLAAWYLKQYDLNWNQILNLIIHPDRRVIPQLQETTAWLASMMPEVFQEVMKTDPDVLLQSDISTIDHENKAQLVESLLKLHHEEKLKYDWRRYNNLNYPGLAALLESYIRDLSKNQWSRLVAIDIARDCNEKAVQDSLVDIALDPAQLHIVREHAAHAVCTIGDEETKARLKPLAIGEAGGDPNDDLKGHALQAVWSQHITVEELLKHLSQPKQSGAIPIIGGVYQNFIATEFVEHLRLSDLPVTLKWLERLLQRYDLHYPFRELADSVMLKAWQNLNEPGVLEAFANVAILRLKQHDGILGDRPQQSYTSESFNYTRDDYLEPLLRESDEKRRQLIETIVLLISESESDCVWLTYLVCSKDVFWIIERVTSAEFPRIADLWVKLLCQTLYWHNLCWKNTRLIDAILEARNISPAMQSEFETEIELSSEKAEQLKADYLQYQNLLKPPEPEPILNPPPQQRVLAALEKVEAGYPQLWSQIVVEMTPIPTSEKYIHRIFKSDITKLPGWKEAEADTKARIVEAAKNYLDAGDPETEKWLGTDQFPHPSFVGYQALYLLAKQEPEFISKIATGTWVKWIPIVLQSISFPHVNTESQEDNVCREIVRAAYQKVPDEFIEALGSLMVRKNYRPRTFYPNDVYRLTKELLDQCLASLIIGRVPDSNLNAGMLEILLTDLFNHDADKAKEIAKSFLPEKVPEFGEARNKAIVAARLLATYPDNSSWSVFWSAVQQDHEFGREVLESIAPQSAFQGQIELKIKEDYLADLYIFLAQQYPEIEQPEPETQELIGIEAQIPGKSNGVRMWKNYIPQRLQARGTPEACNALRKIIRELPEHGERLQPTLLEAESLARRNTWKPPTPEQILQFVGSHQITNQNTHIQTGVLIMQGSNNPNLNFGGSVGAVNLNSTVHGDQIGTQHNYASDQNLVEAFDEIQKIFNCLTQTHPISTESEQQIVVAEVVKEVKQNPTLMKRVKVGGQAFLFEALQKASDQWWVSPFVKAIEAGIKGE